MTRAFTFYVQDVIFVLVTKNWSLAYTDVEWMNDPRFPNGFTMAPSVDLIADTDIFQFPRDEGERQAFQKVCQVYAQQLES